MDSAPTPAAPWSVRSPSTAHSGSGRRQASSNSPSISDSPTAIARREPSRSATHDTAGAPSAAPSMFTLKKAWRAPSDPGKRAASRGRAAGMSSMEANTLPNASAGRMERTGDAMGSAHFLDR